MIITVDDSLDAEPLASTPAAGSLGTRHQLFCVCHAEGFANFEYDGGPGDDRSRFVSVEGSFVRQESGQFRCSMCGKELDDPSQYASML